MPVFAEPTTSTNIQTTARTGHQALGPWLPANVVPNPGMYSTGISRKKPAFEKVAGDTQILHHRDRPDAPPNDDATVRLPAHLRKSYLAIQGGSQLNDSSNDTGVTQAETPVFESPAIYDTQKGPQVSHARTSSRSWSATDANVKLPQEPPKPTHGWQPSISRPTAHAQEMPTILETSMPPRDHPLPLQFHSSLTIKGNTQATTNIGPPADLPFEVPNHQPLSPFRHIEKIAYPLIGLADAEIPTSNPELGRRLFGNPSAVLPANRIVFTGAFGTGKTFLAMACVKRLLTASDTSIFWVSAESETAVAQQLEQIISKHRLDVRYHEDPWHHLSAFIRQLSLSRRFLLVLDNMACAPAEKLDLAQLFRQGSEAYLLVTTPRMSIARRFADTPNVIHMRPFDSGYTAYVLSQGADIPESPIYDQIARQLENDPFVVTQVQNFLQSARVPLIDYGSNLEHIMNPSNWSRTGSLASHARSNEESALSAVIDSCINPAWTQFFGTLMNEDASAAELLSKLSVLGEGRIPAIVLGSKISDTAATRTLIDRFCLTREGNYFHASQLMLAAQRHWLLKQERLVEAHKMALIMIANEYPDATNAMNMQICWEWEPFAHAVLSPTATSWYGRDEACRWNYGMLTQKRKKLYRSSERIEQLDQEVRL
jgi:hypothetical protein